MKAEASVQKRIGIMGGTFDPIHLGHLILAEQAMTQFDLDQVLFMPSSQPPHKSDRKVLDARHRQAMVLLAIRDNDRFSYSDLELCRTGYTYTSDTLRELNSLYPDSTIYFIMGADSLFAVDSWHEPQEIFNRAVILAANRMDLPGEQLQSQIQYLKERFHGSVGLIQMPDIAISSRDIRKKCSEGRPIRYYVPKAVWDYIEEHGLYRPEDSETVDDPVQSESHVSPSCTQEAETADTKEEYAMKPDRLAIKEKMRHKLGIGRYEHTLGVAYTAACLAMRYDADSEAAEIGGLLHDCAKQYDNDTLLKKCRKYELPVTDAEVRNPSLLHAKVGAYFAEHKYDVTDPAILSAIRFHTTGKPDMSLLEKILYVADYIEPRRFKAPNLDKIRGLAFRDLDEAVYEIMSDTLEYLKERPESIDDTTKAACAFYRALHETRAKESSI